MTVQELIAQLIKLPQDAYVCVADQRPPLSRAKDNSSSVFGASYGNMGREKEDKQAVIFTSHFQETPCTGGAE